MTIKVMVPTDFRNQPYDWMLENCNTKAKVKGYVKRGTDGRVYYIDCFEFEDASDAVMFKLRWG